MKRYDLHAHILPHMDHGCGSTATAVAQLALMQETGVSVAAATSHFYPQSILAGDFLEMRDESMARLLATIADAPRPRILPGAEVLICPGLENMDGLRRLCYAGTNLLLLEMPFTNRTWDRALYHTIHEIQRQGIRPILAHVDRYPPHLIEGLFRDMGLWGQVNAESLTHLIKPKHILRWMDEGHIVALGSDLHGKDPKGIMPYRKVLTAMPERIERIMETTERLFAGATLV